VLLAIGNGRIDSSEPNIRYKWTSSAKDAASSDLTQDPSAQPLAFPAAVHRHWFRSLDQGSIYLLIVGTCMPFAAVYLRSGWWCLFFGVMWTIALSGFVSKIMFSHRVEAVAIWSYVLLGWMPIATVPSLMELVPATALWWMLIGGLCYTCGTLFLVFDNRHPLFHAVWHVFVMLGSTCHFMAILLFVGDWPTGT
jgi:hemolysin III